MKVLVTGATGMLGRSICNELNDFEVIGTCFSREREGLLKIDFQNDDLQEHLTRIQPNAIVHCAAIRQPDKCLEYTEELRKLNVDSAITMAQWASDNNSYFIFISSDCVFDGTSPPYSDQDTRMNPINVYCRTKFDAESALRQIPGNIAILRIPVLYSANQQYLEESAMMGFLKNIKGDTDMLLDNIAIRYPTATEDIAKAIRIMINQKLTGVKHYSARQPFTKYQAGQALREFFNLSPEILIPDLNPPQQVPRPRNCELIPSPEFESISHMDYIQVAAELINKFVQSFLPRLHQQYGTSLKFIN